MGQSVPWPSLVWYLIHSAPDTSCSSCSWLVQWWTVAQVGLAGPYGRRPKPQAWFQCGTPLTVLSRCTDSLFYESSSKLQLKALKCLWHQIPVILMCFWNNHFNNLLQKIKFMPLKWTFEISECAVTGSDGEKKHACLQSNATITNTFRLFWVNIRDESSNNVQ